MTAPTPCKIFYNNIVPVSTLSGPTWVESGDVSRENVKTPQMSQVARTVSLAPNKCIIDFIWFDSADDGIVAANLVFTALAFGGCNFTTSAVWRIQAFSDLAFTTPVFDTGSISPDLWPLVWRDSAAKFVDPDEKGMMAVKLFRQSVQSPFWRVDIFDPTNPDGFLELGTAFMGTELTFTYQMANNTPFKRDSNSRRTQSIGGTPFFSRNPSIRTWQLNFPSDTYTKAWDEFDVMIERSGIDRQLLVVPFPDDDARINRQSFFATLKQQPDLVHLAGSQLSTGWELVEWVG